MNNVNEHLPKGGCLETRIYLTIYSTDVMSTDDVSKIMVIEPTKKGRKGEYSEPNSLGKRHQHAHDHWFLISDSFVKSNVLGDHIDGFFEQLEPARKGLEQLKLISGLVIKLSCVYWIDDWADFVLTPAQMKRFFDLGLNLEFEIKDYGEEV